MPAFPSPYVILGGGPGDESAAGRVGTQLAQPSIRPNAALLDRYEPAVTASPITNLQDKFDDNSLDPTQWQTFGTAGTATVTETNQRIEIHLDQADGGSLPRLLSLQHFDLRGRSAVIHVVQDPPADPAQPVLKAICLQSGSGAGGTPEGLVDWNGVAPTNPGAISWQCRYANKGDTTITVKATYTGTDRWFGIVESAGVIGWYTSPDGITWTSFTTQAVNLGAESVIARIQANGVGVVGGFTVAVDDFGITPVNVTIVAPPAKAFAGYPANQVLFGKGTFVLNTVTGSQAITGVGFTPKLVILFGTRQTAEGFASGESFVLGMMDGAGSQRVVAIASNDASVGTKASRNFATSGAAFELVIAGTATTADSIFGYVSFDADGFTINITNAAPSAWIVHYVALGGNDITNVHVGSFTAANVTGLQSSTGSGFKPDLLLTWMTDGAGTGGNEIGIGVAASPTQRGIISGKSSTTSPSAVGNRQRSDKAVGSLVQNVDAIHGEADLVSFDDAGFTINWTTAPADSPAVMYATVKGGKYWVGTDLQATVTGPQAKTGVGLKPHGIVLLSTNRASSVASDFTQERISIGASDGVDEGHVWFSENDNVTTTVVNQKTSTAKVISMNTNPSTVNAEADLQSFDLDGYTLNWTTVDGTAREFITLAVGQFSEPTPPTIVITMVPAAANATASSVAQSLVISPTEISPPAVATASSVTPTILISLLPGAAVATASSVAPVQIISMLPGAATATASRGTTVLIITLLPAAALATASSVAPLPMTVVQPGAMTATASAVAASLVISPTLIIPAVNAIASSVAPVVIVTMISPVAVATASRATTVILLTMTPGAMSATASSVTPVLILSMLPNVMLATASRISPILVETMVAPAGIATAASVAPLLFLTLLPPAMLATALRTAPVPSETMISSPAVATASSTAPVPSISLFPSSPSLATARGNVPSLIFTIPIPPAVATASSVAPVNVMTKVSPPAISTASIGQVNLTLTLSPPPGISVASFKSPVVSTSTILPVEIALADAVSIPPSLFLTLKPNAAFSTATAPIPFLLLSAGALDPNAPRTLLSAGDVDPSEILGTSQPSQLLSADNGEGSQLESAGR